MDLPLEPGGCIMESIDTSLDLLVSARALQLRLLGSEDERRRLQDQIFILEDRLRERDRRLDQYRAEATMNAHALKRSVEEREPMASGFADLVSQCANLEKECLLYECDLEKIMELCGEMAKENEVLRAHVQEDSSVTLVSELESLQRDKENLRTNLIRAEEEVKVLFEENKILDEENKRLLWELNREKHAQRSDKKYSNSACAKEKRKSSLKEGSLGQATNFDVTDTSRPPLSLSKP